jgi:hypothetical protein
MPLFRPRHLGSMLLLKIKQTKLFRKRFFSTGFNHLLMVHVLLLSLIALPVFDFRDLAKLVKT